MKNLLLLITLFLISTGGYLQAQNCGLDSAKISADSNCVFVYWTQELQNITKPIAIQASGVQYFQNGSVGEAYRYSLFVNETLVDCDTTGSIGFIGKINFTIFGAPFECEFTGEGILAECPDDVLVSESENCLVFMLQPEYEGSPLPDSVRLNDTTYYGGEYNPSSPLTSIYLKDTTMACDSSSMNSLLLNDTLFIGQKVCTYADGLLPITILAFNSDSDDNGVTLSWEVNSEEPTRQLYLQKSYNGVDWMNVYEQSLENYNSGQTMDGQFTDRSIEQPRLYYRLHISGYSGEEKYSNILPVTMKDQVINNLFFQSQSRSIMIKAGQNYTGEMHLINTQGQNVMTKKIRILKNTYKEIDVNGQLTPGIYFVKFDNGLIPPAKIFID